MKVLVYFEVGRLRVGALEITYLVRFLMFFSKILVFFLCISKKNRTFAPAFRWKSCRCGEVAILAILLQPLLFNRYQPIAEY